VDKLFVEGKEFLAKYVKEESSNSECALETLLILRKLERIGDHCSNTVEEIVFYIDAKVLKHGKSRE